MSELLNENVTTGELAEKGSTVTVNTGSVDPLPSNGIDTIYQEKNQTITEGGIDVVEFVDKICSPIKTGLKGNKIREKIQNGLKLSFFDGNSFVPSLANVNGGSGTLTEISRNMDKNWIWQSLRIANSQVPSNKDQIMANYFVDDYESILLEAPSYKEDFFAEARKSLATKFALDILTGGSISSATVKTYDAGQADSYTVPSFFSYVNSLPTSSVDISAVTPEFLATSLSGIKLFNASSESTYTGQWASFKTLITKLSQKNKLTVGGINGYLQEYVIITSINTLELVRSKDYQFYKDLSKLEEVGTLIVCPETTVDPYPNASSVAADAQLADVVSLPSLAKGLFVVVSKGVNGLFQPLSNFEKTTSEEFYNNNGNVTLIERQRLCYDIRANGYIFAFQMNLDATYLE